MKRIMNKVMAYHAANPKQNKSTTYYSYIEPRRSGEFTVTTFAARNYKRGPKIVPVNRTWSDRDVFVAMNVWSNVWNHRMIEFDECRNRKHESYGWYIGRWWSNICYKDAGVWLCPNEIILNAESLAKTKYRYFAFDRYRGELQIAQYARLYTRFPVVETLVKNGLARFVNERFLEKLAKDRGFEKYFRSVARTLHGNESAYDLVRAYKNGWSPARAHMENYISLEYRDCPAGVDKHELHAWLTRNHVQYCDWLHYAKDIAHVGGRIDEYGVTFPRNFHEAAEAAALRRHEHNRELAKALEKAKRNRQRRILAVSKRIGKALEKMEDRLAWCVGSFEIVIPTTEEQFVEEGKRMHNCIGGYYGREDCVCFFMHKNGKPFADCEMSDAGKLRQCRLECNASASPETVLIAEAVAKVIAKQLKRKCA